MRLKDEQVYPAAEIGCYVCQHSGESLELWPLVPKERIYASPSTHVHGGYWMLYVKDLEVKRGWHIRNAPICNYHWPRVFTEWEHIARLEVDLARASDAYIERTEGYGREELHRRGSSGDLPRLPLDGEGMA